MADDEKSLSDLFREAKEATERRYQTDPDTPVDFDRTVAIHIQWSEADQAWLASLHHATHPHPLGYVNADGATPTKALRALDERMSI